MSVHSTQSVSSLLSIVDVNEKPADSTGPTSVAMETKDGSHPIKKKEEATTATTTTSRYLEFKDFLDLQTRLVLLPRIESEGVGAVISSYQVMDVLPPDGHQSNNNSNNNTTEVEEESSSSKEHRDDQETCEDLSGFILIGMKSSEENWKEMDFSSILAAIREEKNSPITLQFEKPVMIQVPSSAEEEQPQLQPPQTLDEEKKEEKENQPMKESVTETSQDSWSAFSAWGQRMKKQAAAAADSMAEAAKERIHQAKIPEQISSDRSEKPCDIFLQTSVGAFIPVSSLKESKVTTSSLLLVRKSATEALPGRGCSFQWYRSSKVVPPPQDETASVSSSVSGRTQDTGEVEWLILEGATHAAFQPNTTLVGRRLRCIVIMDHEEQTSSDDSDESDNDLNSVGPSQEVIDLNQPVVGDLTLFNGARQALLRGTKFGVFAGQGNSLNRQFSVEVSIGVGKVRHRQVPMSSVNIFLNSGEETIVLTEDPIQQVSAEADSAKNVTLVFPVPPEDGSMLSAMCNDGNKLLLEAPNRMTRESFLMALGIANYQGKPANLSCRTILYRDPSTVGSLLDDVSVSSANISCASRLSSPAKSEASSVLLNSPTGQSSIGDPDQESIASERNEDETIAALNKELEFMRAKLARKDKVVSELQRQITKSESVYNQTKQALVSCQDDLRQSKGEYNQLSKTLKVTESVIQSQENKIAKTKIDHSREISTFENRISKQAETIAELEKANRILQNEKALLGAAVEARESKLVKMGELQASFDELSEQIEKQDALQLELDESNKRCEDVKIELKKVEDVERQCRSDLNNALAVVDSLKGKIKGKDEKAASCLAQLEPLQKMNQQLKAERNNFKQKNDSLSKEISKICRNGRTVTEIERILADHQTLSDEVELLRKQKRKALEEAHEYRTRYEQAKVAQQIAGVDNETQTALERNAELERLLAEMTEYVNAKEMQLDTLKQVNEHLQTEIHSLAQANLSRNEV